MLRAQQRHVVATIGCWSLIPGRLGCAKGPKPSTGIVIWLIPNAPLGLRFLVASAGLLQGEAPPGDLKAVTKLFLNCVQPHGCGVDVGSKVVEKDLKGKGLGHNSSPFFVGYR